MTQIFGSIIANNAAQNAQSSPVMSAISYASDRTGVDFSYLMQQANLESGMNPTAKAGTSSATGLYQFIDQTWLRMVKTYGADHGYSDYAAAIKQKSNGDFTVSSPSLRREILNLRKDPKAASLMAGELANENKEYLRAQTGREPNATDLYMAHFLGAGGAARFINNMNKNSMMTGAELFPDAARANRGVFFKNGRAQSLGAIYDRFAAKFDSAPNPSSVVFANAAPTASSANLWQGNRAYAALSIPSPGFRNIPMYDANSIENTGTYGLGRVADTSVDNPITALLSAPFRLISGLFT